MRLLFAFKIFTVVAWSGCLFYAAGNGIGDVLNHPLSSLMLLFFMLVFLGQAFTDVSYVAAESFKSHTLAPTAIFVLRFVTMMTAILATLATVFVHISIPI